MCRPQAAGETSDRGRSIRDLGAFWPHSGFPSTKPSLIGPLARLDRADELTLQLTAACKAFLATRPYTIEERHDGHPTTRAFVVMTLGEVPLLPRIIPARSRTICARRSTCWSIS